MRCVEPHFFPVFPPSSSYGCCCFCPLNWCLFALLSTRFNRAKIILTRFVSRRGTQFHKMLSTWAVQVACHVGGTGGGGLASGAVLWRHKIFMYEWMLAGSGTCQFVPRFVVVECSGTLSLLARDAVSVMEIRGIENAREGYNFWGEFRQFCIYNTKSKKMIKEFVTVFQVASNSSTFRERPIFFLNVPRQCQKFSKICK